MEIQYGGLSIACGGRFHCVCTTDTCKAQTGGFERETAHIHRNKVLFDAFLSDTRSKIQTWRVSSKFECNTWSSSGENSVIAIFNRFSKRLKTEDKVSSDSLHLIEYLANKFTFMSLSMSPCPLLDKKEEYLTTLHHVAA